MNINLNKDEVRQNLNGLSSEKQTMFLGSTREQYEEYHSKIDLLITKFKNI